LEGCGWFFCQLLASVCGWLGPFIGCWLPVVGFADVGVTDGCLFVK